MTARELPLRPVARDDPRDELRADCARCAGLCCVAHGFAASADFAEDKPPRRPCRHLRDDFRCGIHDRLPERGFPGCTAYDCFGAGQQVVQVTFGGADWRANPGLAGPMFDAFEVLRGLHELRWYVRAAQALPAAAAVRAELAGAAAELAGLCAGDADALVGLDAGAVHARMVPVLRRAGELARAAVDTGGAARDAAGRPARHDRRRADLAGRPLFEADLRGADLRAASLRGALLIGADLRAADLTGADLTGADLRGADLRGADLGGALFLAPAQPGAARGDATTTLPAGVDRPRTWAGRGPGRG